MKKGRKMTIALFVFVVLVLTAPGFAAPPPKSVNCNKGQSVQDALDRLNKPATIVVTGTCYEHITITMDDVTLQGGTYVGLEPNRSTIVVQGARRVVIEGVTVSGTRNGVVAYDGGSLTLNDSTIAYNTLSGVVSVQNSLATVNKCLIQNNTVNGVMATDNSSLVLTNSTIQNNESTGVSVTRASSARIGQTLLGVAGPNIIQNNVGSGVSIFQASQALIDGNTIENNSGNGVSIEGASATLTNNTIRENQIKGINVNNSGNARIGITDSNTPGPNIIENNIYEGIQSANGAAAYILENIIQSNGLTTNRAGVGIYRAIGRLIGDNTIKGNGGNGVEVNQGALFQGVGDFNLTPGPDIIQGNSRSGISAFNNGTLDIQHATISGNAQNGISLNTHSVLRILDSTVSNNAQNGIWLGGDSGAVFYGTPKATVTLNTNWGVLCGDNESSVDGDTSGVVGNSGGQISCTGF